MDDKVRYFIEKNSSKHELGAIDCSIKPRDGFRTFDFVLEAQYKDCNPVIPQISLIHITTEDLKAIKKVINSTIDQHINTVNKT